MKNVTPLERVREALKEKTKGFRGPERERELVELFAGDIVALADSVSPPDPVVLMLRQGSACLPPDSKPTIEADHAFHLLELATKKERPREQPSA